MTKYYHYNDEGEKKPAHPLYYREGSRFVRYSDYFKAEDGGILTGGQVYDQDGKNQNIMKEGKDDPNAT